MALVKVAEEVKGRIPIILDGGVRRGTDIIKALALGADAVMIGRPVFWGLAVDGSKGVERIIEILEEELRTGMALLGVTRLKDINRSHIFSKPKL